LNGNIYIKITRDKHRHQERAQKSSLHTL